MYEGRLPQNNYRNSARVHAILDIVKKNPGIHYSELVKMTNLTHGVVTHYLFRMEKMKMIRIKRDSRKAFVFLHQSPVKIDNILIHLRKETTGRILIFLLDKKTATFSEIRNITGKSPSTVSLALTHLIEINLVRRISGIIQKYELVDQIIALEAVESITPNTVDVIRDRFEDTFSYL